jgi:hypothetical protein
VAIPDIGQIAPQRLKQFDELGCLCPVNKVTLRSRWARGSASLARRFCLVSTTVAVIRAPKIFSGRAIVLRFHF